MTLLPAGVKVHLAFGYTDMRKGMDGLAVLVQEVLHQDPFTGHIFVFRGRKANLIKIVFWDGTGLCVFAKRLEEGHFPCLWERVVGTEIELTQAELQLLLEGCQWIGRRPLSPSKVDPKRLVLGLRDDKVYSCSTSNANATPKPSASPASPTTRPTGS